MISAIFFMNAKGDLLISRIYRDDVMKGVASAFRSYVLTEKNVLPVKIVGSTVFYHIRVNSLYIVALARSNNNAAVVFEVLHKIVEVFQAYFSTIDENTIKSQYVLIYELLDEILDFGYPQFCTKDELQSLITFGKAKAVQRGNIAIQATGQIPWRSPDIFYKKNQLFLDVIESVNLTVSAKGTILSNDVNGVIKMRTQLSGMPDCSLGMNDKALLLGDSAQKKSIQLADVTFHQCVRLTRFDQDRSINFIPPDGDFDLMKYRTTDNISQQFRLLHNIKESSKTHLSLDINVRALFSELQYGENVRIKIPVPKNAALCKTRCTAGSAKYHPEHAAILWRISRFNGKTQQTITVDVDLVQTTQSQRWDKPPILMDFVIPALTATGLQIRYLKIASDYKTIKWVRYITKAGAIQYRL
ncbi:AP 2 complex subunit mu putative [Entamoeba histolytica]|uniref:AP-2 complex subunit mu, putative n=10 Tax=Entamoeba TaxID=5758 RepID=B1N355_ENTH1|nr:AP-2 complex subunit mu, putative [Entamoeba histolytica HM-1:IMSS]BAN37697.1 AP-2 complex subunit mu, putative [Entamoeba histolytica]EDS89608.1 AP-2 complex subunit mu, putative [Entamoeba histolytica HM-1:IMSS]BAN38727.1 AP-2 complex subunit mu, putative [Entamoeba histolytica]BAN39473.1 AP-2 complex subunit mu, putative [Entamoeba histolytica]GAT94287.1 AP 2 complex subunit mu putative [Entamoeba histolytica]|eukprot:XP_001913621.1 AP-2 complex subunit mu, putative [Entamoeba histolytica HM-1:IMSS]